MKNMYIFTYMCFQNVNCKVHLICLCGTCAKQESIPVVCIPPAFALPRVGVCPGGVCLGGVYLEGICLGCVCLGGVCLGGVCLRCLSRGCLPMGVYHVIYPIMHIMLHVCCPYTN